MSVTIDIQGCPHRVARMDAQAVRVLMAAGALPFDGRVELVDGALIEMSPSNDAHGAVLSDLIFGLKKRLSRQYGVIADAAIYLSDNLMLAPDIVVLLRPKLSHEASGADLDLVIEISNTTLAQDLGWKAERYARHGVREYWVVDLEGEHLHIHRDPDPSGYQRIDVLDWTEEARPAFLPGLSLVLAELLNE